MHSATSATAAAADAVAAALAVCLQRPALQVASPLPQRNEQTVPPQPLGRNAVSLCIGALAVVRAFPPLTIVHGAR